MTWLEARLDAGVRSVALLATMAAATILGCGSGDGATVACTTGTGTAKTCVEYTIPQGASSEAISGQNAACVDDGGTASATCSHQGADGACRVISKAPGSPVVTTWVYAGNAATEMMACVSNGQTWLTP